MPRHFQFTLRQMFLAVTIAAVVIAISVKVWGHYADKNELLKALHGLDSTIDIVAIEVRPETSGLNFVDICDSPECMRYLNKCVRRATTYWEPSKLPKHKSTIPDWAVGLQMPKYSATLRFSTGSSLSGTFYPSADDFEFDIFERFLQGSDPTEFIIEFDDDRPQELLDFMKKVMLESRWYQMRQAEPTH